MLQPGLLELSYQSPGQVALSQFAAALSVLEFSCNVLLLPIFGFFIAFATVLLQPDCLPQGVSSPKQRCLWRCSGSRLQCFMCSVNNGWPFCSVSRCMIDQKWLIIKL